MDGRSVEFSPVERAHLDTLRARFAAGEWPRPIDASFARQHGIELAMELVIAAPDRRIFHCVVYRRDASCEASCIDVLFQVTPMHPSPPDADEVLRWLVASVHACVADEDLGAWAMLHGRTIDGHRGPAYRGIVRNTTSVEAFVVQLEKEGALLRDFLGADAFAELLAAVDYTSTSKQEERQ